MAKLLLILFIGLVFESAGIVLLKKGISQIGEARALTLPEVGRAIKEGATNGKVLLGILFEAIFFAALLILMHKSDISFLWPLTALSFVFATFASIWFLGENVTGVRWAGVVLIMAGAALISYSEHTRECPRPVAAASETAPPGS